MRFPAALSIPESWSAAWRAPPEIHVGDGRGNIRKLTAAKIVFATNALSLDVSGLRDEMHPPILFRDSWKPVFDWHPQNVEHGRNAIVAGAYAGHGVALSSYLGTWAAEVLLGKRKLPR